MECVREKLIMTYQFKAPQNGKAVLLRADDHPALTSQCPLASNSSSHSQAAPELEYVGETSLTVKSPLTRREYRFECRGERLRVLRRDLDWMLFIPSLRQVA